MSGKNEKLTGFDLRQSGRSRFLNYLGTDLRASQLQYPFGLYSYHPKKTKISTTKVT